MKLLSLLHRLDEGLRIPRAQFDAILNDSQFHMGFEFEFAFRRDDADWDMEEVASQLEGVVGSTVSVYHGHDADKDDYTEWWLETDGRIGSEKFERYLQLELVSPIMTMREGLERIATIFRWARSRDDVEVNQRTGFHINLSYGSADDMRKNLDPIKLLVLMGEKHALAAFDRNNNSYAQSLLDMIRGRLKDNPSKFDPSRRSFQDIITRIKTVLPRISYGRVALNKLHQGYLEFRIAGGSDYINKFDTVRNFIMGWSYLIEVACDPQRHRQEYGKKLYELVNHVVEPPSDQTELRRIYMKWKKQLNDDDIKILYDFITRVGRKGDSIKEFVEALDRTYPNWPAADILTDIRQALRIRLPEFYSYMFDQYQATGHVKGRTILGIFLLKQSNKAWDCNPDNLNQNDRKLYQMFGKSLEIDPNMGEHAFHVLDRLISVANADFRTNYLSEQIGQISLKLISYWSIQLAIPVRVLPHSYVARQIDNKFRAPANYNVNDQEGLRNWLRRMIAECKSIEPMDNANSYYFRSIINVFKSCLQKHSPSNEIRYFLINTFMHWIIDSMNWDIKINYNSMMIHLLYLCDRSFDLKRANPLIAYVYENERTPPKVFQTHPVEELKHDPARFFSTISNVLHGSNLLNRTLLQTQLKHTDWDAQLFLLPASTIYLQDEETAEWINAHFIRDHWMTWNKIEALKLIVMALVGKLAITDRINEWANFLFFFPRGAFRIYPTIMRIADENIRQRIFGLIGDFLRPAVEAAEKAV